MSVPHIVFYDRTSLFVSQTACLLTFVTYCLAMYPDVLRRLRQEILSTIGTTRAPR
jgi:hypothetical protein